MIDAIESDAEDVHRVPWKEWPSKKGRSDSMAIKEQELGTFDNQQISIPYDYPASDERKCCNQAHS